MLTLYHQFVFQVPDFKILARMGYQRGMEIPEELARQIERVKKLGYLLSEPIGATRDFLVENNDGEKVMLKAVSGKQSMSPKVHESKSLQESQTNRPTALSNFLIENCKLKIENYRYLLISSRQVAKLLSGCARATLLACTIGDKLLKYLNAHQQNGEIASAVMLDAFGSEAVEEVAEEITRTLSARAKVENYKLTFRFACGYGDWDVREQKNVLAALDAPELNIRVGAGGIMEPQKSITAVMGWVGHY
jgi:hypothetical protein